MRILYFADVVGKPGREGVRFMLPKWRAEHEPDLIVANGENIAHGMGIGRAQASEMFAMGVQVLTGGNHSFEGPGALDLLADSTSPVIRPANAHPDLPGRGWIIVKTAGNEDALIINLIGQTTGKYRYDSPFAALDQTLSEIPNKPKHILLDWHAEHTSEKVVMGWYADGKVSAVVGSHTHVPTADARILPKGTAYISDVGMTGPHNSIIGIDPIASIERFTKQLPIKPALIETGPIEVSAVLIETDPATGKALYIKLIREIIPR